MDTVGLRVPIKQSRDFSTFDVCNVSKDLALHRGALRLQTASVNLWTFSVNMASPSRIHFPLLHTTELRHYHVTCITLLPSSSSNLSPAFVIYAFSARPLAVDRHLNKGIIISSGGGGGGGGRGGGSG
jgi:hypothetical protein